MHASDVVLAGLGAVAAVAGVTAAACAADPIVMMAHQDVVPVEGQDWEHDPFGAEVVDGQIWGRGTLDTKCIVGAFFEAAEAEQGGCRRQRRRQRRRRCRTVYIMMNQTLESARFGGLSRQNVR